MIFEPASRVPLPTTDVISYIFSDPPYDHDQPVVTSSSLEIEYVLTGADLHRCERLLAVDFLQSG